MGEGEGQNPLRVLIVDREEAVRDLLAAELSAAGYEVDTLSSGNGFSEDMVSLIRPDLLLVDPFLPDVPVDAVERVLAALHRRGAFKLVLIDGGEDPVRLASLAAACHADGFVGKRQLLGAPVDAVAEQLLPEAEIVAEVEPLPDAEAAAEGRLDIELTPEPPPRRPPARPGGGRPGPSRPRPPAVPPGMARPSGVLDLIEEEIGEIGKVPAQPVADYRVEVNLFSRHNFYVGPTGDLRTGGVFVATALLPAVGERLRVVLQLPFVQPLDLEGPVEWVREGNPASRVTAGMGISLAHLPADWRAALERFFQERAPLAHLPRTPGQR